MNRRRFLQGVAAAAVAAPVAAQLAPAIPETVSAILHPGEYYFSGPPVVYARMIMRMAEGNNMCPVGTIMHYVGDLLPDGWAECSDEMVQDLLMRLQRPAAG